MLIRELSVPAEPVPLAVPSEPATGGGVLGLPPLESWPHANLLDTRGPPLAPALPLPPLSHGSDGAAAGSGPCHQFSEPWALLRKWPLFPEGGWKCPP